jgi:serine/threonine protein phosphatase 1
MRRFVLGDIHGAYRALVQVLERSNFDKTSDKLIFLGDVVDGWPETYECIEELLTIENIIPIMGNHDEWALDWMRYSATPAVWVTQGGKSTIDSYLKNGFCPESHRRFLSSMTYSWVEDETKLFVHGGVPVKPNLGTGKRTVHHHKKVSVNDLAWNRSLYYAALKEKLDISPYTEIYIGHTTTTSFGANRPVCKQGVWMMDNGAGWGGKLSIMDIDTKDYWQSDSVRILYPDLAGRRSR